VPEDHELPDRLRPVLAVVYLVYNAGLTSPAEPGLCPEAIRLARILTTLMPDEPEVAGLLALLLLTGPVARRARGPTGLWCCSASRTADGGIRP
jgi:RNA polymerase sigma-70 factor (ECF subfamily)